MAKKGQKFNKSNKEFKEILIKDVLKFGQIHTSQLHKVKYETVCSLYCSYKKGTLNKKEGPSGPKDLEY